jgi:hypothetical protein
VWLFVHTNERRQVHNTPTMKADFFLRNGDNDSDSAVDLNDSEAGTDMVPNRPEPTTIAKQETQDVFRLKLVVLFVLVIAAIGTAACVFVYLKNSEESLFLNQFEGDSTKIFDAIGSNLEKTLGSLDSFGVTMVSAARMTNQSWPFVTIPDFAVRMAKVLPLSDAIVLYFNPVVSPDQRETWEKYSVKNHHWINESMAVQAKWDGYYGPKENSEDYWPIIHGDFGDIPRNTT